jgi:DNA repair exonuclease SbcCD nuclease subunit
MRILYYTDPHHSDTAPIMRQDTYRTDILNKEEQILKAAKKCDAVIIGGDIFHQRNPDKVSHKLVNMILEIYREFPMTIIVPGNHDFDTSIDDITYKSPFGALRFLDNVTVLHDHYVHIGDRIMVYGFGGGDFFSHDILLQCCDNYYSSNSGSGFFHIGVLHASVARKKLPFETLTAAKVTRFFDLICLGHLHDYKDMTEVISAPGALSRGVLKLDESYDREVGYALIDIVGSQVQNQFVPLDVRPADEVFKINKREQRKLEETAVGNLLDFLHSLEVPRVMSAEKLMEHIKGMNLEYDVERRAIEILRSL